MKKNQVAPLISSDNSNLSKLEEYQRIPVAELELVEEVESFGTKKESMTVTIEDEDECESEDQFELGVPYEE